MVTQPEVHIVRTDDRLYDVAEIVVDVLMRHAGIHVVGRRFTYSEAQRAEASALFANAVAVMADLSQAMQNGPGFAYTLESFVAALRADRPLTYVPNR